MKRVGKEPRLLPSVMEAIANLKEKQGSTQKQIFEHVHHVLRKNKENSRNLTMQIRRALEHGISSGLIKQRSGKYSLGLDKRDYAIFRRFREISDPLADCNTCRRKGRGRKRGKRGRRRSRRRGRRGRRRALSGDERTDDSLSDSGRSVGGGGTPEPMDRSRRRRKRGRKGRRRGRRGRRRSTHEDHSESNESVHKETQPVNPPEKRRSENEKLDNNFPANSSNNNHGSNHHQERRQEDEEIDCGNPECLCNIKQEDDSPRCMSRENYYTDSYLN